jgi:hypothetical protein
MTSCFRRALLALAASLAVTPVVWAQDKAGDKVELFKAMADKQIEVKYIPKNAEEARVIIKNKTNKPLNVELPEAFAGVPVLAQAGFGGAGGAGGAGGQVGGGGFGGAGGGGAGGGGAGGGGGFFMNVAPEKQAEIKVATLCLEHGKPDPRPAMAYEIKPLASVISDPATQELVKMFGKGQLGHAAAQAAAWHLANKMSWEELSAKRIKRASGASYPYFDPRDLQAAMAIANAARTQGQQNAVETGAVSNSR